jgi:hypothetical protein
VRHALIGRGDREDHPEREREQHRHRYGCGHACAAATPRAAPVEPVTPVEPITPVTPAIPAARAAAPVIVKHCATSPIEPSAARLARYPTVIG